MIAVLSALEAELALLTNRLTNPQETDLAGWLGRTGTIAGGQVLLAHAGLGKVNTAALTILIWERYRPQVMVFTGVAGGLDPALEIGDVVIGERTIQHDSGVLTSEGLAVYQAGHIPFFNPSDHLGFSPSEKLRHTARGIADGIELTPVLGRQPQIVFGTILTGDYFLQDTTMREHLHSALDGQAVEMEGGAFAQVATRLGVDHLVVRSISDLAGAGADYDFDRFVTEAAANSARLVLALIERLQEDHRDHPIGP